MMEFGSDIEENVYSFGHAVGKTLGNSFLWMKLNQYCHICICILCTYSWIRELFFICVSLCRQFHMLMYYSVSFTGDFSKEDVAAALLHLSLLDTIQCISNAATMENLKHIFICGSYAARDFVREMFTTEWERRKFAMLFMRGQVIHYHISALQIHVWLVHDQETIIPIVIVFLSVQWFLSLVCGIHTHIYFSLDTGLINPY